MTHGDKYILQEVSKRLPKKNTQVFGVSNYSNAVRGFYDHYNNKWYSKDFKHPNETFSFWFEKTN